VWSYPSEQIVRISFPPSFLTGAILFPTCPAESILDSFWFLLFNGFVHFFPPPPCPLQNRTERSPRGGKETSKEDPPPPPGRNKLPSQMRGSLPVLSFPSPHPSSVPVFLCVRSNVRSVPSFFGSHGKRGESLSPPLFPRFVYNEFDPAPTHLFPVFRWTPLAFFFFSNFSGRLISSSSLLPS